MLLRIRSNVGMWRIDGLDETKSTIYDVYQNILKTRPHIVYEKQLCYDIECNTLIPSNDNHTTLQQLGFKHGTIIYCRVDPTTANDISITTTSSASATIHQENNNGNNEVDHHLMTDTKSTTTTNQPQQQQQMNHMRRTIDSDGKIILVPCNEAPRVGEEKGFRKGMMALRDIKMHWTLSDFVAMDSQYEFKIQRQTDSICKQVSLDVPSISKFQSYLQKISFQRKRFGYLYGKYVDEDGNPVTTETNANENNDNKKLIATKVIVEAIYEPPQEIDAGAAEGFVQLDDPYEESVNLIASYLGWKKIGWIYGCEPRESGYVMSSAEIIMAAEYQLEAANGVYETPFVTVKVSPTSLNNNGTIINTPVQQVTVEAFQVSQQCMKMVAEEALEVNGDDLKFCQVNETFTAIQEGKGSKTIDNNFFITVVPIIQHTSDIMIADFPNMNRDIDDRTPSNHELKIQLSKSGTAGWTFIDRLSDFNLLIYISQFLDVKEDISKICKSITDKNISLDDGYKILIKSIAGLEGSY